jgi:hypothetical protein
VRLTTRQANAISAAVWLVGLGVLITTGSWWPGIMFLVGVSSVVQGSVAGRGWYAWQAGLWSIGIGVWAWTGYQLLVLFGLIALSGALAAFVKPPGLDRKPQADASSIDGL